MGSFSTPGTSSTILDTASSAWGRSQADPAAPILAIGRLLATAGIVPAADDFGAILGWLEAQCVAAGLDPSFFSTGAPPPIGYSLVINGVLAGGVHSLLIPTAHTFSGQLEGDGTPEPLATFDVRAGQVLRLDAFVTADAGAAEVTNLNTYTPDGLPGDAIIRGGTAVTYGELPASATTGTGSTIVEFPTAGTVTLSGAAQSSTGDPVSTVATLVVTPVRLAQP